MRIPKIRLQNFRNYADSTIEPGNAKFVVVRGSNTGGKSSIQHGLDMALTLTAPGLDGLGRNFERKIKRGATKAVITADVQGKQHLVQREVTLNTNTSGKTFKDKCIDDSEWIPAPFERNLKANKEAITVSLYTDYFVLRLDEDKQKSLLAKLVLPAQHDFHEDIVSAVERVLGSGTIDFSGEPFSVIDSAYKKLYKVRETVNRQVNDFVIPDSLGTMGGNHTSASLQASLTDARDARRKILNEKDAALSKASAGDVERARIQGRIDSLQEKIVEEEGRLRDADAKMLSDAKRKEWLKIAGNKESYDKFVQARADIAASIASFKKESERWNSVPDNSSECDACGQKVSKEHVLNMRQYYADEYKRAVADDDAMLQDMKLLGDVEGAGNVLAKHDAAVKERESIRGIVAEKVKLQKDQKEKLIAMGAKVDAVASFVQPLSDADARITAMEGQLRPVIAAEERVKEIAQKTEELEKLKVKAENVDKLVKVFDKDGIKADLIAEHIGSFEDKLNSVLDAWGYETSLSIEPFDFSVTNAKGDTSPVSELSGSEELMFSLALQCAVSRAAGVGFVVVDRLDTFLPPMRAKANKCLYQMAQEGILEQVWILVSDENREVPNLPDSAFFMVSGGTVERLVVG